MRYKDLLRDLQLEIAAAVNLHEGKSIEDNIFQIVNNKIEGLEDRELLTLVVEEQEMAALGFAMTYPKAFMQPPHSFVGLMRCAIIDMLGEDLMDYFNAV